MNGEEATRNFYTWELTGRGYSLFPYPIKPEPPFREFFHRFNQTEYPDDGKVPRLFERIFPAKKDEASPRDQTETKPKSFEYTPFFRQYKINFAKAEDIDNRSVVEFINMLSEGERPFSFEVVGTSENLDIYTTCGVEDGPRLGHLLSAYFPGIVVSNTIDFPFNPDKEVLIADFGYDEEFMRPIKTSTNGWKSLLPILDNLKEEETVMFQILFEGVENPWANSILNAVTVGSKPFFADSPEMLTCAKEKIACPLFAVVFRLAVQSYTKTQAEKLANEVVLNIRGASDSGFNSLIPLSNAGYPYKSHLENLKLRRTNRLGMIMNSSELSSFVSFPDTTRLFAGQVKTKAVPKSLTDNDYHIGINIHNGTEKEVSLNDQQRLRHCHVIGTTGTGKSTLLANLFLEDVRKGNGCALFDPHGDTIEDIIPHIPENRLADVILLDPSDPEYAFGFNLLSAKTEVEKIVLSSDLVDAFVRHSTSWGDQMTSVLSNAINAFLSSEKGGTLVDLRRFLLESLFRKEFLKTVKDPNILYYWNNEYVLLKKASISPLLTRLDTFLRPRIIRNILSQREGLDFGEVLNGRKILLIKLSQGLIGEENSYLLGTLILSKLYQVAQARQLKEKTDRHPAYIYLDEFHNFITPSIKAILSGARKYGVGLILAHQELGQIQTSELFTSVLSNTNIRICFRLGEADAKKLESGFAFFDSLDLQNLDTGQAVIRVGKSSDDCSLKTSLLKEIPPNDNHQVITDNARKMYSKKIKEIEADLFRQIPKYIESEPPIVVPKTEPEKPQTEIETKGREYLEQLEEKQEIREHRYLQTFIKKMAEQRGFKAVIEEEVAGGRIDVVLQRDTLKIACEIAVANSVEYEVKNILKCQNAGYMPVCVVSRDTKHLRKIEEKAGAEVSQMGHFFTPEQLTEFLDSLAEKKEETRIRGYRVKVRYVHE